MKEVSKHVQQLLKTVRDEFDKEDTSVRERQIRLYKKLKLYWSGFQRVWWDSVAHDWRVWDDLSQEENNDSAYYDKPINVFRAYLESIIAALSIQIPAVKCIPDDADNPLDISTAKAGNKIYELVSKHNNAPLLWLKLLFIYCTEGLVHVYNYTKEDKRYGEYDKKNTVDEEVDAYVCPFCGMQLADDMFTQQVKDEFDPDDSDALLHTLVEGDDDIVCPECARVIDPSLEKKKIIVTRFVGITREPKSRQCIEAYGGLFVKTPTYAQCQEDMPYLNLSYETHRSMVLERYSHLREEGGLNSISTSGYDDYDRWGRLSTQYNGEFPSNMVTVRNWWFRPSSFNCLNDEADVNLLKEMFPDGVRVVFCNDQFGEAHNESLDDCWTLARNPLSDYIQFDPLGLLLISIQDITNDLTALELQTIEQGILQTFVDPAVVDTVAYSASESAPGGLFPTKAVPSNKNIAEGFYQFKAAALSPEVAPFGQNIQSMGQLVSGALPSLFGGEAAAGSKTASEYAMSRGQALQRLQNTWKMFTTLWKELFGKVIPAYIKDVAEDERYVEQDKTGNYINVFIRKAELQGKIGSVELETSEQLPISWAQKRDIMKELMAMNLPMLMETLLSPENLPLIKDAFGLEELEIPGEEDRQKQIEEIQLLLQSEPLQSEQMDEMTGEVMPQELPSVPVDPDIDNHEIEANICRNWLISEVGRQAKLDNPAGYHNVLLHYKEHLQIVQMQQMQMMQQQMMMQNDAAGSKSSNGSGGSSKANGSGKGPKMPTKEIAAKTGEGNGQRTPIQ